MSEEVKQRWDRKSIIQVIFLILLTAAIASMITAIVTIIKYKEMLSNPLGYNMDKFNLNSCTCRDTSDRSIVINSISYKAPELFEDLNYNNRTSG